MSPKAGDLEKGRNKDPVGYATVFFTVDKKV